MISAELVTFSEQRKPGERKNIKPQILPPGVHYELMRKIRKRIINNLWEKATDEQILAIEEFLSLDKRKSK